MIEMEYLRNRIDYNDVITWDLLKFTRNQKSKWNKIENFKNGFLNKRIYYNIK